VKPPSAITSTLFFTADPGCCIESVNTVKAKVLNPNQLIQYFCVALPHCYCGTVGDPASCHVNDSHIIKLHER
jgi:hypothetical protein